MQLGRSIGAVAIGVLSGLAFGAGAQDMLDQQFEGIAAIGIGNVSSLTDRAQRFTVGLSGQLTRIELSISKAAVAMDGDVLQVDIYPTNAMDVPVEDEMQSLGGTTVLGSELSTTLVPLDMHEVSLTGENIMVTNGEVLAIVLRSTVQHTDSFRWGGDLSGGAIGGSHFNRSSTWNPQSGSFDARYRTYVPEPSASAAVAVAALGRWRCTRGREV